jgi:hypothetical protein
MHGFHSGCSANSACLKLQVRSALKSTAHAARPKPQRDVSWQFPDLALAVNQPRNARALPLTFHRGLITIVKLDVLILTAEWRHVEHIHQPVQLVESRAERREGLVNLLVIS